MLGLDGSGRVGQYADFAQWQTGQARIARKNTDASGRRKSKKSKGKTVAGGLTAREDAELRDMDAAILKAEDRVGQCIKATEDPAVGADHIEAQKRWEELESARKQVETLYARWEELEGRVV